MSKRAEIMLGRKRCLSVLREKGFNKIMVGKKLSRK
jgi:hypothetical protein